MKTFYFDSKESFLKELDGKIYAICDKEGHYLCDIIEDDYVKLTNDKTLIDLDMHREFSTEANRDANVLLTIDMDKKGYAEFREEYGVLIYINS